MESLETCEEKARMFQSTKETFTDLRRESLKRFSKLRDWSANLHEIRNQKVLRRGLLFPRDNLKITSSIYPATSLDTVLSEDYVTNPVRTCLYRP